GGEGHAVRAERYRVDRVQRDCGGPAELLAGSYVPEFYAVLAAGGECCAVRAERHRVVRVAVAAGECDADLGTGGHVPQPQVWVTGGQDAAVRAEGYRALSAYTGARPARVLAGDVPQLLVSASAGGGQHRAVRAE